MPSPPHRSGALALGLPRCRNVGLVAAFCALVAASATIVALGGSRAQAAPAGEPAVTSAAIGSSAAELESAVSSLPASDLNLSAAELERTISETAAKGSSVPGLTGMVEELVRQLLRNPSATTGEVVSKVNELLAGLSGGQITVGKILESLTPDQVTRALAGLLSPEAVSRLIGKLDELGGGAPALQVLLEDLGKAVAGSGSGAEAVSDLVSRLETLAGSGGLSKFLEQVESSLPAEARGEVEALITAIRTGSPANVEAAIKALLGALNPAEIGTLTGALTGALTPAQLETLTKGLLASLAPVLSTNTPAELAGALGTSASGVADDLDRSAGTLPQAMPAVTSKLPAESSALSLVSGAEDVLGRDINGGSGGAGPTIIVTIPASTAPSASASVAGSRAGAAKAARRFRVLSHRVHGDTATLVLQIPTAGRLVIQGRGVRRQVRNVLRAQRMTVIVKLARRAVESLRRAHRRGFTFKVRVAFRPVTGARTSQRVSLRFR